MYEDERISGDYVTVVRSFNRCESGVCKLSNRVNEAGKAIRVYGSDKTGLFGAFDRLGNNISGSDVPFSWYTEHLGEFELSTSAAMRLMDKYGMGEARFYWCLSRSIEKENLRRRNK